MKKGAYKVILAGVLLSSSILAFGGDAKKDEKWNVIFLVCDDMNDYGITKTEDVLTPNLDKLRESSVTFSMANCSAPLCMPSRASLYTGIYPHHSGVYVNGGDPWNDSEALRQAETLPELFRRNGYYTFGRGKVYHAKLTDGRIERNFDNRPIYEGGFGPFPDPKHRVLSEKDRFKKFWGVQAFPDSIFPDVINTDAAIEFLNEEHEKPFFVTLGFWRPHTPFTAPQRFFDIYDPDKIEIPKGYLENDLDDVPEYGKSLLDPFGRFEVTGANNVDRWKHFIHGYYACTSFVDWNIGRLMDTLEKSEYAENTIVVIFSDNGFHVGIKNHWEKNTLWNSSAVVPLIIKLPKSPVSGGVVNSPVGLIDLYPTIVDYCKLDSPTQKLDGVSLRPFLEEPGVSWDRPALTNLGENLISVQSKQYRYVMYPDGTSELYDFKKDPYEWHNLAEEKKYAPVIKEHQKYLPKTYMKAVPGGRKN
ncbi:sulfatase [Sunxiuqinia sp. A32]|uniref:sulfatase n=1 Tax=Sunxiuqinia sp. A32 TaxID=3461496 RepID=UPI00404629BB